jgi:hypothetical protein
MTEQAPRRHLLTVAGGLAAAAAVSPALAQNQAAAPATASALQDPVGKYPKPPSRCSSSRGPALPAA